jgi:hypothetical protein
MTLERCPKCQTVSLPPLALSMHKRICDPRPVWLRRAQSGEQSLARDMSALRGAS